jgi:hypothetical protein
MANTFGILTIFVLLATLFVASKNKTLYEEEIANVIVEKDRLRVSQERLAAATKKLAEINAEIPEVEARTEELRAQVEERRATNTRSEAQLQSKNDESTRNHERITGLQARIATFGNVDQLVVRLRNLNSELQELNDPDTGNPARSARVESLTAQAEQLNSDNIAATALLDGYARGESRPGMTTTIRSIYPNWGFVTLAAGGVYGIAGNSNMDVIRDNQIIAKLQVTAVEPNSATATIVPGSVLDDAVLAVGDVVVPSARIEGN